MQLVKTKHPLPQEIRTILHSCAEELQSVYQNGSYDSLYSAIVPPADTSALERVKKTIDDKCQQTPKAVVVIGIGGSALGTQAVAEALRGRYSNVNPKLIVLDAVSKRDITATKKQLEDYNPEEVVVFMVSKSGTTTETVANFELTIQHIFLADATWLKRVVIVSDEDSELSKLAAEKAIAHLTIPQKIGGRYSVFSPVGIAPLYALGLDVDELLTGAKDALEGNLLVDTEDNEAMVTAYNIFSHYKNGQTVHDTFIFEPSLESVGKWYRQLFAESLAKKENKYHEEVYSGMVPTVSIGSTDLHSVGQLYMEGPDTVLTTFVLVNEEDDLSITEENRVLAGLLPILDGRSTKDINTAIANGITEAYQQIGRPFIIEELPDTSAYSIGYYLQYKMVQVIYLSVLFEVNPFDQPGVELYKEITRRELSDE